MTAHFKASSSKWEKDVPFLIPLFLYTNTCHGTKMYIQLDFKYFDHVTLIKKLA